MLIKFSDNLFLYIFVQNIRSDRHISSLIAIPKKGCIPGIFPLEFPPSFLVFPSSFPPYLFFYSDGTISRLSSFVQSLIKSWTVKGVAGDGGTFSFPSTFYLFLLSCGAFTTFPIEFLSLNSSGPSTCPNIITHFSVISSKDLTSYDTIKNVHRDFPSAQCSSLLNMFCLSRKIFVYRHLYGVFCLRDVLQVLAR